MADHKRLIVPVVFASLALFFLLSLAQAQVRVSSEGCSPDSIQEALNAASSIDTVVVESGTYREGLIIGKRIVLMGLDTGGGRPVLAPGIGRIILAAKGITLKGFDISSPLDDGSGNCTLEVVLPATIFLNDFSGKQSICPEETASWNSSNAINYQYKSQVIRGYLGNYWADYNGLDENKDGIGDEPMVLNDKNVDYYPLMEPVESFRISGEKETKMELIHARLNEPFKIAIPANPSTGNEWNPDYDNALLDLVSSQFEKGPSEAIGAGGTSIFTFKPHRPGKTTISFVYKRSWENIVADTRSYHVEITA